MDGSCSSNLCRICLSDCALIPIFEKLNEYQDIDAKLKLCIGEEVLDIIGYPRNICNACYEMVNEIIFFQNRYKESCNILEKSLQVVFKQEFVEISSELEIENILIDTEIVENVKAEPKIFFDDAQQFEELVTPLIKNKQSKNQKKSCPKSKHCNKTSGKKQNGKILKTKTNRIASAILEGQFVFCGEQWCLNQTEKNNKNNTIKKEKIEKNCLVPVKQKTKITQIDHSTIVKKKKKRPAPCPTLCELCGKSFSSQKLLYRHRSICHTPSIQTTWQCSLCPKNYNSPRALQFHIQVKHTDKKYVCPVCGVTYPCQYLLNVHNKRVHLKILRKRKLYQCELCDKTYTTAKCLLMHERSVHTGERPAACTVCDSKFVHEDYLKEHMRLHTGETPYKCPVCNRGYAQRCNMKSHIKHNHRISQLDDVLRETIPQRFLRLMKP